MHKEFRNHLKDLNIKDKYFDIDQYLFNLLPYYQGNEFGNLLNSKENLDLLNDRFIVFELDNIKEDEILLPVITIIIMDTYISKMRQLRGFRKIMLIEEAWKAIMRDDMAGYIKYLFKTVRKFKGEAWVVTQEIQDLTGSSNIIKDAIVNNADTRILLDQRKYEKKFSIVEDLLSLSEKEKNLVLSVNKNLDLTRNYVEVFITFGGRKSAVYGVEVSQAEYFAFTTKEDEKLRVSTKASKLKGNVESAIREIVLENNQAKEIIS